MDYREPPAGLSKRARRFVGVHGIWLEASAVSHRRLQWEGAGIPSAVVDRVDEYQARWGGLALPAAPGLPEDAAGPRMLGADVPQKEDELPDQGWSFEAGPQRTAVPYSFLISSDGTLGIAGGDDEKWIPLHGSIDGWVESLALAYAAVDIADTITKLAGPATDSLDLTSMQPVELVDGRANGWWYRPGLLVALYAGESELFGRPGYRTAFLYSGNIDREWL
ncbi:hypothetical protein [Actinoplanes sp. N902-109]|uniref:hypothetical protein n=1 Tax=Actinoplanes sp. (strain N902-109) TaxID=649831 RepID=UPI001E49B50E|nr:hypothetical protein [Actinoplanes sp. N902-109]